MEGVEDIPGSALAEGIVYLGGGTPIQTACGFEDSLDDMYRYMMAACGPDPNEAKIARYCEESLGHFDWLVARDGGIFAFKAPFYGSLGGQGLDDIVGLTS